MNFHAGLPSLMPLVLIVTSVFAPPATMATPSDTTWFGGTRFDPIDQRWEALPDSVWTFESGVGSSINLDPAVKPVGYHRSMEGWEHYDLGVSEAQYWQRFRRRSMSEFEPPACVGSQLPGFSGQHALFAGLTDSEADTLCWPGGRGYGNNWRVNCEQTFEYSGGSVTLQFDYFVEMAPGYSLTSLELSTPVGSEHFHAFLWAVDGVGQGHVSLTLQPGTTLPSTPGPVILRFALFSDDEVSDEDGLFDSGCGAFAVDNVRITGGISHVADFEIDANGWRETFVPDDFHSGSTDFASLSAVKDRPPEPSASCALGDSALTFNAPTPQLVWGYHPCEQDNAVLSPWIDLDETDIQSLHGLLLGYSGHIRSDQTYLFLRTGVQWYPEVCPESGVSRTSPMEFLPNYLSLNPSVCLTFPSQRLQDLSSLVPPGARKVRVALELINLNIYFLCDGFFGASTTTAPWFDNIRVGVVHDAVSAVADVTPLPEVRWLGMPRPNPLSRGRPVDIPIEGPALAWLAADVFDISGRAIRRLHRGPFDPTRQRLAWDGRDDGGLPAAGGLYVVRAASSNGAQSRKILIVH